MEDMADVTTSPTIETRPPELDGWTVLAVVAAVALGLVILITTVVLVATSVMDRAGLGLLDQTWFMMSVYSTQTLVFVGSVYLLAVRRKRLPWTALGLRPVSRRWLLGAVAAAVVISFGEDLVERAVGLDMGETMARHLAPGGFGWGNLLLSVAVVGVVVPFGEELVFRGVLYTWLRRRWGVIVGALASALPFGLLHGDPTWAVLAGLLGVVLALAYELTRSLWTPVVMHSVNNVIAVVATYAVHVD
jgi:membrane protease YdiL (CAAX protease family)